MANLMSKTKKELVEIIAALEADKGALEKEGKRAAKDLKSALAKQEAMSAKQGKLEEQISLLQQQVDEGVQVGAEATEAELTQDMDEALALLDSLADASSEKILLVDHAAIIQYAGPGACLHLGVENGDSLKGQPFGSLCADDGSGKIEQKLMKACMKGEKTKIKKVILNVPEARKASLKAIPVSYKEEPALKVVIKE